MRPIQFEAELAEGHKGVVHAEVPFDPQAKWRRQPFRLAGRRHGWPVRASIDGHAFDGYIGERWGRRFVMIDAATLRQAGVGAGDPVALTLAPSDEPAAISRAIEQSKITTQPGKARADALPPPRLDVRRPLTMLRKLLARWPGVIETKTFGHPTFQAGAKKTFAVLDDHERPGLLCLVVKLPRPEQARLLREERFTPCKFGAKHGWTSMIVDGDTDWAQAGALLLASYRLVAGRRLIAELEAA
jgi:predicted DNA-binding protein (MmcQ/YjbR family)